MHIYEYFCLILIHSNTLNLGNFDAQSCVVAVVVKLNLNLNLNIGQAA